MDDVDALLQSLVAHIGRTIHAASDAATVVASLRCMASLLHHDADVPTDGGRGGADAGKLSVLKDLDEISKLCRDKALQAFPKTSPDSVLSVAFYRGPCFAAFAQLLLHKVSLDWLPLFSSKDQTILFDEFFTHSPPSESLRFLGHGLSLEQISEENEGSSALYTPRAQAERLLALIFLSRQGVKELSLSFSLPAKAIPEAGAYRRIFAANCAQHQQEFAQLLSSIPDRISLQAPSELRSPFYIQAIVSQLIEAAEEIRTIGAANRNLTRKESDSAVFKFTGQVIMGLCRRGHAGVIASQVVPSLMQHLLISARDCGIELSETRYTSSSLERIIENLQLSIWPSLTAQITDSYALERFSEALIREIANKADITDLQAFCALHALYGEDIEKRATARNLFTEKLIFEKVLPIRCLKWILHVAIFRSPPITSQEGLQSRLGENELCNKMVRRLAEAWAMKEFIQGALHQRQAYLTAALGMCLGKMSKEALESTDGLVARLLEGISNRLDSPLSPVRQMAKRIALAFSTVVDPRRPLLIDEEDSEEDLLNWEGLDQQLAGRTLAVAALKAAKAEVDKEKHSDNNGKLQHDLDSERQQGVSNDCGANDKNQKRVKRDLRRVKKEKLALEEDDPDAIVRLGDYSFASDDSLSSETDSDNDNDAPQLLPYDMSDEETDSGTGKIAFQLSELAINLRNSEKPDAVEEALKVAEKLFLARPEELDHMAADLARTLVHVKCSGVEGEEDIVEERRYKALVALLSCSPLQTVPVLTSQIFSQHVDTSQRILILDVMAAGARVLASGDQENVSSGKDRRGLLTSVAAQTDHTPWYEPVEGVGSAGAGPWVEVPSELLGGSVVGWGNKYQRELPRRPGQIPVGKSRRWGNRALQLREEKGKEIHTQHSYRNKFVPLAPAFMLPVMRDHDKKWPHLDVLGRDYLVLGKILYTLGVCMECISMQHQAIVLATGVLEMLRSREIGRHPETFVRRSALFTVSRVLSALHPSDVVAAFSSETPSIVGHLDWLREWALEIAMGDPDSDCSTMAAACVHLHGEMALQVQRSMHLQETPRRTLDIDLNSSRPIIMPF